MRILVNGIHLYFDVEGAGLVPHGAQMQAKPTLLLHGGPGADHSLYKPCLSRFADIAQVVCTRRAPDPNTWAPAQSRPEVFAQCGHGVVADAPERAEQVLREFVAQVCGDESGGCS